MRCQKEKKWKKSNSVLVAVSAGYIVFRESLFSNPPLVSFFPQVDKSKQSADSDSEEVLYEDEESSDVDEEEANYSDTTM